MPDNGMTNEGRDAGSVNWGGSVTDVATPWYAVRLYTLRLRDVARWFAHAGIGYFIPMEFREIETADGVHVRRLVPVVRNLVFISKDRSEADMKQMLAVAPFKLSVIRKSEDAAAFYEIPYAQMREFQVMCNPLIEMRRYVSEEEARLKTGQPVVVTHGPLRGMTGKLVRCSKKYYLLKEVPGMAVMIKVSRWCCRAVGG